MTEATCEHDWVTFFDGSVSCRKCGEPVPRDPFQPWYREPAPKPDDRMIALLERIEQNTRPLRNDQVSVTCIKCGSQWYWDLENGTLMLNPVQVVCLDCHQKAKERT